MCLRSYERVEAKIAGQGRATTTPDERRDTSRAKQRTMIRCCDGTISKTSPYQPKLSRRTTTRVPKHNEVSSSLAYHPGSPNREASQTTASSSHHTSPRKPLLHKRREIIRIIIHHDDRIRGSLPIPIARLVAFVVDSIIVGVIICCNLVVVDLSHVEHRLGTHTFSTLVELNGVRVQAWDVRWRAGRVWRGGDECNAMLGVHPSPSDAELVNYHSDFFW